MSQDLLSKNNCTGHVSSDLGFRVTTITSTMTTCSANVFTMWLNEALSGPCGEICTTSCKTTLRGEAHETSLLWTLCRRLMAAAALAHSGFMKLTGHSCTRKALNNWGVTQTRMLLWSLKRAIHSGGWSENFDTKSPSPHKQPGVHSWAGGI